MPLQYLVNKKVVFEPQTYRVWSIDSPDAPVTLFVPAAQCFGLLVQNPGKVLSQQYLFQEVWEKNGLYVTPNTLYQNIAMLRKTLKSVGLEEDVVLTIPRQGFSFVGQIKMNQDEEEDNNKEKFLNTQSQPEVQMTDWVPSLTKSRIISLFGSYGIPFFIIALSLAFFTWQLWGKNAETKTIVNEYYYMGTVDHCQLYSSWQGKYESILHFRHILSTTRNSCQPGEYAYLTFIDNNHRSSLIKCSHPFKEQKNSCAVYIVQDSLNEKK